MKLPDSKGYDSILTITDHDCMKVVILLPCREDMDSLDVAKLYLHQVFPFVGLPEWVISDQDPKFTSKVFQEICALLEVKQNISSAYHPQTDGQSEKTNQHMETALRIFGNFQQDRWSKLLPIVQYQLNSHVSTTTNQIPYETWMGFVPIAHQPHRESVLPTLETHKETLQNAWRQAIESITHAQSLWNKPTKYHPYQLGEKVWLDGVNLRTSHPMHKLCLKRFGPFVITEKLSQVTYWLELPPMWWLHNAFHATLLSPYHEMEEHGMNYLSLAPELIEGEQEWEVKKILATRRYSR